MVRSTDLCHRATHDWSLFWTALFRPAGLFRPRSTRARLSRSPPDLINPIKNKRAAVSYGPREACIGAGGPRRRAFSYPYGAERRPATACEPKSVLRQSHSTSDHLLSIVDDSPQLRLVCDTCQTIPGVGCPNYRIIIRASTQIVRIQMLSSVVRVACIITWGVKQCSIVVLARTGDRRIFKTCFRHRL